MSRHFSRQSLKPGSPKSRLSGERSPERDGNNNITPVLQQLHWLQVLERIEFKVACLVFKSLAGQAPEYLSETVISFVGHSGLPTPELALYQEHTTISVTELSPFLVHICGTHYPKISLRQADISYEHFKRQLNTFLEITQHRDFFIFAPH